MSGRAIHRSVAASLHLFCVYKPIFRRQTWNWLLLKLLFAQSPKVCIADVDFCRENEFLLLNIDDPWKRWSDGLHREGVF